jgi:hypothetical protein
VSFLPSKRFRPAWAIAWVASIGSGLAAIGPNIGGRYDPTLAVLTLTLIAVIWYTYYSYRSINRAEPTLLAYNLEGSITPRCVHLNAVIENRSARQVKVRVHAQLWLDDSEVRLAPFYRGESVLDLPPFEVFTGVIEIDPELLKLAENKDGTASFGYHSVKGMISLLWEDDVLESGSLGPRHYHASPREPGITPVLGSENLQPLFGPLERTIRSLPRSG